MTSTRLTPVSSRRDFLEKSAFGFGTLALGYLLDKERQVWGNQSVEVPGPLAPKPAHFPARAKSVILLFMQGGPSHLDTFDPKPLLNKLDGKPLPESFKSGDLALQFIKASESKLMGPKCVFSRHGDSGLEISDLYPHLATFADELAVIRSCYHKTFVHGPALDVMHTGSLIQGHPTAGAWVVYGLGCESDELPAYVAMSDGIFKTSSRAFSNGYLPAVYQGTNLRIQGSPIMNLRPPAAMGPGQQRKLLDQIRVWNGAHMEARPGDSRLAAQIANYELAFRMQMAAPELVDLSREPESIKRLYGIDGSPTGAFGRMCLLARRMVERGVRFIQLYSTGWDTHSSNFERHRVNTTKTDKPMAALLGDLRQRGLLDSTLILWMGEFGRTPVMQGSDGRDHNPYGFSSWMAGGGIRGGKVIGATDELGFRAVEDKVHAHDLHATMLSLLGLDHERLTYFSQGRNRSLTDVGGENDLSARLLSG